MLAGQRVSRGMSGGAIGAVLWFELLLLGGLMALSPAIMLASAFCDAGPECGPRAVLWKVLAPALAIGATFLVAVVILDLAAARSGQPRPRSEPQSRQGPPGHRDRLAGRLHAGQGGRR